MADSPRTYFVITTRGDLGPFTLGDIAGMARAGEVRPEDQVRTAFGRNLGTVAGLEQARSAEAGAHPPSRPREPAPIRGRLVIALVIGGTVLIGSAVAISCVLGAPADPPSAVAAGAAPSPPPASPPPASPPPTTPPSAPPPPPASPRAAEDGPAFIESGGLVVCGAEHPTRNQTRGDSTGWMPMGGPGPAGMGTPRRHGNASWSTGAELAYAIVISTPGRYRVWMRVESADANSNSAYVGFDGVQLGKDFDNRSVPGCCWVGHTPSVALEPGRHVLQVRRREAGYRIDRIVLVREGGPAPVGDGPPESPRR